MYELKPVRNKKIYEEIVEQVKQLIAEGVLAPGDKLVSEKELAEKLQVGRSAVREAFRALEALGILEVKPGEGAFIRRVEPQAFTEMLALALLMDKNTTKELMELRRILEVESAGLASLRHTPEDLARMEEALAEMEADIRAGNLGEKADWKFHYAVAVATHNSLVVELMNTIAGTMQKVLRKARMELYRTPGTPQRLLNEHRAIYQAIREGRDGDARRAMFEHLDKVEKGLKV